MVQNVGVGQVLLYYVQTVWERGGWCGMSLNISISISLLWARCRRLFVHGVTFYPTEAVQCREVLELISSM